ncbi:MAG: hypothetical protein D6723_09465 [Acidobacteria bacterium]|nr:MAG: hypothetical protein D6723_09465 [Acidobacteriota bacterium]
MARITRVAFHAETSSSPISEEVPGVKEHIVILGGGFAGVYTAMHLERHLRDDPDVEITLINRENYFVFQPLLPEVISGSIEIQHVINPIRRLCPRTNLLMRNVESIDLEGRSVTTSPGFRPTPTQLRYDHLVITLGTVMNFSRLPGLQQHGFPFKNLGDALHLRNHIIHVLEEADNERDPQLRRSLLTFVIAGGGFSGVESAAEINDFVRAAAQNYRHIDPDEPRVILLHSGDRILPELNEELGRFAERLLRERRVEIRFQTRLAGATAHAAVLRGGEKIPTQTLVATVPAGPHPLIEALPCRKERGRIVVNEYLEVPEYPTVWALGDGAWIPDLKTGGICPPTAQYAVREAKCVAENIVSALRDRPKKPFRFSAQGMAGALGHRSAVAEVMGVRFSGFPAWLIWRTIYWSKLPGWERKLRVGIDWFLDLLLPKDIVQIKTGRSESIMQEHYEAGEVIFRQGDLGDRVYALIRGNVQVVREEATGERVLATLGPGDCFGEMALLAAAPRNATIRAVNSVDTLVIYRRDFEALLNHLPGMRQIFERLMESRRP